MKEEEFDICSSHPISLNSEIGGVGGEGEKREHTSAGNEAGNVVIVEAVYALEIPRIDY